MTSPYLLSCYPYYLHHVPSYYLHQGDHGELGLRLLLTAHHPLLTAHYPLLTAYYSLLTAYWLLLTTCKVTTENSALATAELARIENQAAAAELVKAADDARAQGEMDSESRRIAAEAAADTQRTDRQQQQEERRSGFEVSREATVQQHSDRCALRTCWLPPTHSFLCVHLT